MAQPKRPYLTISKRLSINNEPASVLVDRLMTWADEHRKVLVGHYNRPVEVETELRTDDFGSVQTYVEIKAAYYLLPAGSAPLNHVVSDTD